MIAAARHLRSLEPQRTIVAVPVGSHEGCRRLNTEVDEVICLAVPDRFGAVGKWYREFDQVSDESVQHLLWRSRESRGRSSVNRV